MNNYEYIIAGLPVIDSSFKFIGTTPNELIEEIKDQLCTKDNKLVDLLLDGYKEENLNEEFYKVVLNQSNKFLKDYFLFDLNLRNAKVKFLNKALNRPADKDIMFIHGEDGELIEFDFEESDLVEDILSNTDLLSREKGIDDLIWEVVSNYTTFNYFDINAILAFIVKMQVVARWYKLDEETGREMFRKLVDEVRGTFTGVDFNENK